MDNEEGMHDLQVQTQGELPVWTEQPELPNSQGLPCPPSARRELGTACSLVGAARRLFTGSTYHAHWQLRDGVCAWRRWVFLNRKTCVLRYDTSTHQGQNVLVTDSAPPFMNPSHLRQEDLREGRLFSWDGWKVVCLKVFLERYLVVGGTGGSLVIIDLLNEDEVVLTCKLPGAMINSLALRRRDQDTRLLVCENSLRSTFQEYTFPEMTTVTVSSVPDSQCYTLINGLAFSPNDRWLVLVGDAPVVFLYDASQVGEYKLVKTFHTLGGNNKVSWNLSSDRFAIASEAGCCQVYRWRELDDQESVFLERTIWNCGKPSRSDITRGTGVILSEWRQAGTVPLVRFGTPPLPKDHLIVFQSVDYVQVVDLRFDISQVVHLPTVLRSLTMGHEEEEAQSFAIAGGDVTEDGGRLFVGTSGKDKRGGGGLFEFVLEKVPSLVDIALSYIQLHFNQHWTAEECDRRLPADLKSRLFNTHRPTVSPQLPPLVDDDPLPEDDEEEDEDRRFQVLCTNLLLCAGWPDLERTE